MPENYITYSQIEPLLRDGMTGAELKTALCKMTRLDPAKYRFVTKGHSAFFTPFWEAMRDGLYVERFDSPTGSIYICAHDELVSPDEHIFSPPAPRGEGK